MQEPADRNSFNNLESSQHPEPDEAWATAGPSRSNTSLMRMSHTILAIGECRLTSVTRDAPVRLSQSVINNFQNSPEVGRAPIQIVLHITHTVLQTDSTRAQDAELKVQDRVNAELKRIRDSQAQKLDSLTASLTTNPPKEDAASSEPQRATTGLAYHLSSPFYQDSNTKVAAPASADSGRSHDSVEKEIMDLRAKLDARKKVEKVPVEVETAKEKLVQCLRTNDRRPLDCWQEVEQFKVQVGKLEQAFIQKAGR